MAKRTLPDTAYAEGQKAKSENTPADKNPYKGDRTRDADPQDRYTAYLRDCWMAGHYGDEMPAPYKGDIPKD